MKKLEVKKFIPPKKLSEYPVGPSCESGFICEVTSGMRTFYPVINIEKCTKCLRCFLVCPDGAIDKSKEQIEVDYNFCKGCGICEKECKLKAISMVKEVEA